ncbi:MAG: restriction endonuclease subunit S [Candidatus Cyclonatronum sp.]|uniref:restriction endonuclease subunit S n=1 Tax=Cyclonatronum sp. TaxID=3024185 RepID=UPI0025C6B3DF|nr:restriction endonuclease subunit S [Cyclonatronum sp.]MCH8485764.1 restriction endonuclease subunit S [Cyclonatronum sp.]
MKWEKSTLGELIKSYGGKIQTGPFGSQLHQHDYKSEGIPVVMPKDIINDRIETGSIARINDDDADRLRKHKLNIGDLVLPRRGDINKRAICKPENEGWLCGTGCLKIRLNDEIVDPNYLYYYFTLSQVVKSILNKAIGSTMLNLSGAILSSTELVYPPLPTQRNIASILSAYDDLIENNMKRIKLLEEKAFLRYKQIVREEKFQLKAFNKVADYINGYPFKPKDWKEEGLPIIKIKELKGGVQNNTPRNDGENVPEKYLIENKDILFAWSASIGAYLWASGKAILNQHIFNVKPFDKELHNWLYFSLLERIPDFINLSNGATMQHIKKSALGMVFLPIPPKKVCEEFQKETEPILNLIVNLNQQNTKLREARDILLPKLMNGQIEV